MAIGASDTDDLFASMFSSVLIYRRIRREHIYCREGDYANDTEGEPSSAVVFSRARCFH